MSPYWFGVGVGPPGVVPPEQFGGYGFPVGLIESVGVGASPPTGFPPSVPTITFGE